MSRVVIWSPNYAPELTGIPPLVTDAAEWLASCGYDVHVVAPMPNYPERRIQPGYRGQLWLTEQRGGVVVHRSWLRVRPEERFLDKALYELTASTFAFPHVVAQLRRGDALLCVVPTLLAAVYAAALPSRTRLILWIQDLVAQAAEVMDVSQPARRILRTVGSLERWAVGRADRVVVCSPGFREHFVRQGADPARIDVVYNWADLDWIRAVPPRSDGGEVRYLYSGNLGYTQGFETMIEAMRSVGDRVRMDIVGQGNAAQDVMRLAQSLVNVTVRTPVPREEFPGLLAAHDAHVVLQRRAAAGANLPSKIATYLASGRPIIASIDPATSAAQLLRESGAALLVEPESPTALANAMRELSEQPKLRHELGLRARAFAEARFDKVNALSRLKAAVVP